MTTAIKNIIITAANETSQECWDTCTTDQLDELARASQNNSHWEAATDGLPMDGDFEYVEEVLGRELTEEEEDHFSKGYRYHLEARSNYRWMMVTREQDMKMKALAEQTADAYAMEYVRNACI